MNRRTFISRIGKGRTTFVRPFPMRGASIQKMLEIAVLSAVKTSAGKKWYRCKISRQYYGKIYQKGICTVIMRKILFTVFILLAALLFAANGLNPLRLHIIANSNAREDQQLKLEIRDYILQEKNDLLKNCKDKLQAQQIISANAESLENLANEVLEAHGKAYRAQVQVGKSTFPDKYYGAICYPAGEYDAVRIVLGDGGGENWWCVMFPPLCLVQTEGQAGEAVEYTSLLLTWLEGIFA